MMVTRAQIALVRSLSERRERQQEGLFVAEGPKLVGELAVSGLRVERVFAVAGASFPGAEEVSGKEMERMSHLKSPSTVLALVRLPEWRFDPTAPRRELVLALDGVQDPGNLGTIVRVADWFGIREVLCSPDCADCFNPKVVQATMGAVARVRVHYTELTGVLSAPEVPVFGTFLDGEPVYRADLSPAGILVMGSEGRGISAEVERLVTRRLFIPPYPAGAATSESLNVAVATAIACAEFRRRLL